MRSCLPSPACGTLTVKRYRVLVKQCEKRAIHGQIGISVDLQAHGGWALRWGPRIPCSGNRELSGFGVRVYPSGAMVYVVQTRALGKSKRVTLGRHGVISADQARRKAAMTIARIKAGEDPSPTPSVSVAELTVADLAERYLKEHAEVHCKPRTKEAYRWPGGEIRAAGVGQARDRGGGTRSTSRRCTTGHRETPYQANRILEVVRKMFNLAEAWGLRKDGANPCRFVQKYKEKKRERFLTEDEFRRLGQVLNEVEAEGSETFSAVTAIRLLMLTGCRLNEIQTLRWEDVDLAAGELRLLDSKTGARMVPLSRASVAVLSALPPPGGQSLGYRRQEAGRPLDRSSASLAAHPHARRAGRCADP